MSMAINKPKHAHKEEQKFAKRKVKRKAGGATHTRKNRIKKIASISPTDDVSLPSLCSSNREGVSTAAWTCTLGVRDWVPQRTTKGGEARDLDVPCDRFDIAGTTHVNELVLRHGTMSSSTLKLSPHPVLFKKLSRRQVPSKLQQRTSAAAASPSPSPFMLERYLFNLVRALVHPLHNFLQCHHGLHNADEVQVMLMPKEGPIAAADRAIDSDPNAIVARSGGCDSSMFRRCYVATNNETLTQDSLQRAVHQWGVAGVFQISEFVLVRGVKGQHAEQKLLGHLRSRIFTSAKFPLHTCDFVSAADQKALVVGERLPCAACRLFAVLFEDVAVLLPSHGHMYLSTFLPSLAALESSNAATEKAKKQIRHAFANPGAAAQLLLSSAHQRVLR